MRRQDITFQGKLNELLLDTDKTIIQDKIRILKDTNPDPLQLCNGHDFMKAFSQFIKQVGNGNIVKHEYIASSCRMVFAFNHYSRTELYLNTKMWAVNNKSVIY